MLIERLAKELHCRLYVLDGRRATGVLPGLTPPPDELAEAVRRDLANRDGPRPALTRIAVGRSTAVVVPVPSRRPTVLVVSPGRGSRPDLALLQHAATIAALQVERITADREQARRLGAELLAPPGRRNPRGRVGGSAARHPRSRRRAAGPRSVWQRWRCGRWRAAPPPHRARHRASTAAAGLVPVRLDARQSGWPGRAAQGARQWRLDRCQRPVSQCVARSRRGTGGPVGAPSSSGGWR